ncbi:MAG: hypothetical protein AB8H80_03175 [Planctomycetota bacterium]
MADREEPAAPLRQALQLVRKTPGDRKRRGNGDAQEPVEHATAWWVPGADPKAWLAAAVDLQLPWREIVVLRMPYSRRNPAVRGALLAWRRAGPQTTQPEAARRSQRPLLDYVCRAGGVYLPSSAELHPPTTDDELRRLAADRLLVFDATAGLVAFDADDVATLAQLVTPASQNHAPPPATSARWSCAHPGTFAEHRLQSVRPSELLDLDSFFRAASASIGSESPRKLSSRSPGTPETSIPSKRLPPRPGLRGALSKGMARFVLGITKHAPRNADKPTWIDRVERWALAKLEAHRAGFRARDEAKRRREIERLLQLLADNPGEGLRYALPLAGAHPTRGLSQGADSLHRGDADYRYSKLNRSASADPWDVSLAQRTQLQAHYRHLANSEATTGRHRRAAYILAHLLGDLRSAAKVLAEGAHHREAAQLYLDSLGDHAAAAKCLAAGGWLAEAAQLESDREQWRNAGDLYLLDGDRNRADALYKRAYELLLATQKPLDAALLRAERLRQPHAALANLNTLQEQRPADAKVYAARLALAHRLGEDQQLAGMLQEHPMPAVARSFFGRFAAAISLLAIRMPESSLREQAHDRVRQLTARTAKSGDTTRSDIEHGLAAMLRSLPNDPALRRDVQLFRQKRRKQDSGSTAASTDHHDLHGPLRLQRQRAQIVAGPSARLAAANTDCILVLSAKRPAQAVSIPWFQAQPGRSSRPGGASKEEALMQAGLPHWQDDGSVIAELRGGRRDNLFWLSTSPLAPESDAAPGEGMAPAVCLTLANAGHGYQPVMEQRREAWVASDYTGEGDFVSLRYVEDSVVFERQRSDGSRSRTEVIPGLTAGEETIFLAAACDRVVVACGRSVLVRDEQRWILFEAASAITSIARPNTASDSGVILAMQQGLHVLHVDGIAHAHSGQGLELLAAELVAPTVGWTGHIVLAIDSEHIWLAHCVAGEAGNPGRTQARGQVLAAYTSGQPRKILTGPEARSVAFVFDQLVTIEQVVGGIATLSS